MKKKKVFTLSSIILSTSLVVSPFAGAAELKDEVIDPLETIVANKDNGKAKGKGNSSKKSEEEDNNEEVEAVDLESEEVEELETEDEVEVDEETDTEADETDKEETEETEENEETEEEELEEEELEEDAEEDDEGKEGKKKGLLKALQNTKGTPAESVIKALVEEKYDLEEITSTVNELADTELVEENVEDSEGTETEEEEAIEEEEAESKKKQFKELAKELRKQLKEQEKEIKKSLQEARKESPEKYQQELEKYLSTVEKLAELHEKAEDDEGAFELQTEAVTTDLTNLKSYKKLAKLYDKVNKYSGLKAFVNGKHPEFDVPPVIKEGRTLVPFRAISESLNAEVSWNGDENAVYVTRNGVEVKLVIGESKAYVNGEEVELDVPAEITNNRTIVPVRFISEAFGALVEWDEETESVIIVDETIEEAESDDQSTTETEEVTEGTESEETEGTETVNTEDTEIVNEESTETELDTTIEDTESVQ